MPPLDPSTPQVIIWTYLPHTTHYSLLTTQVIIWTFGLPGSTYEDNAARGLDSCLRVNAALKAQGLAPRTGVTVGSAFCGLVGARYRCEYSVMGPSVNLAARLMTSCESKAVELLCNDALYDEVTRLTLLTLALTH